MAGSGGCKVFVKYQAGEVISPGLYKTDKPVEGIVTFSYPLGRMDDMTDHYCLVFQIELMIIILMPS